MNATIAKPAHMVLRQCRPAMIATFGFSLAINLLMFTGPLYMISVYDRVLTSRHEATLLSLSLLAAGALALYGALELLRARILVRSGIVFDRALAAPLAARTFGSASRAGSQPLRDLDQLREFLTGSAPVVFCDLPWTPLFVVMAYCMHPLLGHAALAGIMGLLVLTLSAEMLTRKPLQGAQEAAQVAAGLAAAAVQNRETVAAFGMARRLAGQWSVRHDAVLSLQARASDRASLIVAISKTYRMILQSGILGLGVWLAIRQEIGAGAIFAANLLVGRALQPVDQIVQHWKAFIGARGAWARVAQTLGNGPQPAEAMDLPRPRGEMAVEGLVLRAEGVARPILAGINFRLPAGEMLTVVGQSGAGKSSLLRTLVRVCSPASGVVRLDGAALEQYDDERRGGLVGYLPQAVELFAGTVADNIARFGYVDAAAVVEAAQMAGVHEMILRLPKGYETDIGASGSALSGGQRIGLARALYGKPALLVLDEPNSNLDLAGEEALARALEGARRAGTTIVVSSHRQPLVAMADRVLVLAEGTQQLYGPRAEVLEKMAPRPVRAA